MGAEKGTASTFSKPAENEPKQGSQLSRPLSIWQRCIRAFGAMPKTKEVTFSVPGWVSVTLEPNDVERQAAWKLYVELATRVGSQPFDRSTGSLRAVLESLYGVFVLTRTILREAGPDVAHTENSFGPIAIGFLTEVLAPFLLKWNEPLREYEAQRKPEISSVGHEHHWDRYADMCRDFDDLRPTIEGYVNALAGIAGVLRVGTADSKA